MIIKELLEDAVEVEDTKLITEVRNDDLILDVKRILVGAGARILFYPTLLYNVLRNKLQSEFQWWNKVDEFVLLGAVPFPTDVPHLKNLGVHGVITLNEPYETLVPTSLYSAYGIEHLVIPTRDYLFAPSLGDICQAVEFIHKNASCRRTTYVHCKAGRGRSTTIVLCYLVEHKNMTPTAAYEYVRSSRPRVRLAASQLKAVREYYDLKRKVTKSCILQNFSLKAFTCGETLPSPTFDDESIVIVSESDLVGYNTRGIGTSVWADPNLSMIYRTQFTGQAALASLSCLWFRLYAHRKVDSSKLNSEVCCVEGQVLDISVY